MKKLSQKLAAAMTVGVMVGSSNVAVAGGQNFEVMTEQIAGAASGIPTLINLVGYIGGSALGVAGILKLKGHVENPGQVALKDALIRIGAGGGLLSLPFVFTAMQQSISDDGGDFTTFEVIDAGDAGITGFGG